MILSQTSIYTLLRAMGAGLISGRDRGAKETRVTEAYAMDLRSRYRRPPQPINQEALGGTLVLLHKGPAQWVAVAQRRADCGPTKRPSGPGHLLCPYQWCF